jgi:hypothetical protein
MRKTMVGVATAAVAAFASPSLAADLPAVPYSDRGVTYQGEVHTYEREYRRPAPRVAIAPPVMAAPVVTETVLVPAPVVVRRPIVVARPRVIVEDYPIYASPRVYAYGGYPVRHHGPWGHRRHFYRGY